METFTKLSCNDIILPERLNCPFYYQPHELCLRTMEEVKNVIESMEGWRDEIGQGKMFGVLIVRNAFGEVGYLKAYSGQIGSREDWDGWVPAVFDYLQPDGYFVAHEKEISLLNQEIKHMERSDRYRLDCARLAERKRVAEEQVEEYRLFMSKEKVIRKHRRDAGEDPSLLIGESQFQKAEMKRLKQRLQDELIPLQHRVDDFSAKLVSLKNKRKQMSDELQRWLFSKFVLLNGRGEARNLLDIFRNTAQGIPPSGAGECCAPKLLQYAFQNGLQPIAISEFWWGKSPVGEIRKHMSFYPACQGKCRPILDFMLQGVDVEQNPLETAETVTTLDIVYQDDWFVVVDKPAGMLSVPGKAQRFSALEILSEQLSQVSLYPLHRLDMQTSGLLMFAKDENIYRLMQKAFATRKVKKTYYAVLDGVLSGPQEGTIDLPLSPDYINRPRQKVDTTEGKPALTHYYILYIEGDRTHILLYPQTGRTHQLRVHCAHPDGLGMPIIGDDLYGTHSVRLMLHAEKLEFAHPVTGEKLAIERNHPF